MKQHEPNCDTYLSKRFTSSDEYEKEHLRKDWVNKAKAAEGLFDDFSKRADNPAGKKFLDMGFGNAVICGVFSKRGACVYGVEVDQTLFDIGQAHVKKNNIKADLFLYDGTKLPFADNFFDFVFSTSVLEHVSHPDVFLKEAARVLAPHGKMYLAFPNKYALRDNHTGIYFLGFLPRPLAQVLVKMLGKGSLNDWNLHFVSYFMLKRILKKNKIPFRVIFDTDSSSRSRRLFKKVLASIGIHYGALLSHIIIVLEKK